LAIILGLLPMRKGGGGKKKYKGVSVGKGRVEGGAETMSLHLEGGAKLIGGERKEIKESAAHIIK